MLTKEASNPMDYGRVLHKTRPTYSLKYSKRIFTSPYSYLFIDFIVQPLLKHLSKKELLCLGTLYFSNKWKSALYRRLPTLLEFLGHFTPDPQLGHWSLHLCPHPLSDWHNTGYFWRKKVCLVLFIDTQKAFDIDWQDGLLQKIKPHQPNTYPQLILLYWSKLNLIPSL